MFLHQSRIAGNKVPFACATILLAHVSLMFAVSASADDQVSVTEAIIVDATGATSESLRLTFDVPIDVADLKAELSTQGHVDIEVVGESAVVSTRGEIVESASKHSGPRRDARLHGDVSMALDGYTDIFCGIYSYRFVDPAGEYTVQRQCGVPAAPWSFKLASYWIANCVTNTLFERGMAFRVVGVGPKPMNAPHGPVPCNYRFHGVYNWVPSGTKIEYNDIVTFRHAVGPGGTAELLVYGKLHFRSQG